MKIDKFIRILALPHECHTQLQSHSTSDLQCPPRRILTGSIHIIRENDLVGIFFEKPCLLYSEGSPEGSYYIRDTMGMQGNRIHVALDHDRLPLFADLRQCLIDSKKETTLIENGAFRRIQILRLTVIHDTTAECHHAPLQIQNGKHAAIAEHIKIVSILVPAKPAGCEYLRIYLLFRREVMV